MSEFIKSAAFILASIILARFALPANITPIIAMAVFLPYLTKNKHLQTLLPIGILFLTDIFLGFYGATMFFVYGTMLLISFLSRSTYNAKFTGILKTYVLSVLLCHIIVNFGVYLNGLGTASIIQTYLAAIPFDFRLLVSTLAFSTLFYGSNFAVSRFINKQVSGQNPIDFA